MEKKESLRIKVISGVMASTGAVLLLLSLLAYAVVHEGVGDQMVNIFIYIIVSVSALLGCLLPAKFGVRNDPKGKTLTIAADILLVIICSTITDGAVTSWFEIPISILVGFLLSCVICMKKRKPTKRRKKSYR